ncbi:MAG TPA: class I SAM-dependent methyltransferase [Pseudonocardiaceae bacterium]|jgi:SAM-dependent methyltransferase|nr:class I SAM-dependent methyltransferase [Pseudonocardiaceae bacterium]
MALAPQDIVATGYDRIADRHLAWMNEIRGDPRLRLLHALIARLPADPAVLDLGCGAGIPCTAILAERGDVTGVDVSARQLELARARVPGARFVHADMTTVDIPAAAFDAVTAFYSIGHVPRVRHASLFARVAAWLRPGGHFLAALPCSGGADDTVADWLGAPMFFSGNDAPTNRRLLAEAGLTVVVDELVTMAEPEGPATFQWVIARKS